jgi:transposase
MNIIGTDISKRWFDGYCPQRQQNRQFSNDVKGWKQFFRWIPGDAHVVMEASGPYYLNLASWLHEQGCTVSVVNPLVIRRYSQMKLTRTKTDAKDAALIASYGADQQPKSWEPPSNLRQALKQLMSLRDGLLRQQAVLNGQAEAFGQQDVEPLVGTLIAEQRGQIARQLARIDKRMEALAQQEWAIQLEALLGIPGIGEKTAIHLLMITDGFTRFDSGRKLASYVGLCPRVWESGSSVKGRGSITKMGCPQMRKLLYMCSWAAKTCNPGCRQMYNRLKKKGKPEKVIKVAIAHKLLRQAFAVGKKGEPFSEKKAMAA